MITEINFALGRVSSFLDRNIGYVTVFITEAYECAEEGDIVALGRRCLTLLETLDFKFYLVIAGISDLLYKRNYEVIAACVSGYALHKFFKEGGHFHLLKESARAQICRGPLFILKWAIKKEIITPKDAAEFNIHRLDALKIAIEALPPFSLQEELDSKFVFACMGRGTPETIRYLHQKGADLEQIDWSGRTPIMLAAGFGHPDFVKALYELGADLTKIDDYGKNLLHVACSGISNRNVIEKTLPYILSLPGMKDKINDKNLAGRTPLFYLDYHLKELGDLMIQNSADITIKDNRGLNVLDDACSHNCLEKIRYYYQKGMDFNFGYSVTQINPNTKFGWLYELMSSRTILTLIDEGLLSLFHEDETTGNSLFHFALRCGDFDLFKELLKRRLQRGHTVNYVMNRQISQTPKRKNMPLSSLRNKSEETVLKIAVEEAIGHHQMDQDKKELLKIIQLLWKAGIRPDPEVDQRAQRNPELKKLFSELQS